MEHFILGTMSDDCPLCRAAREGATADQVAAMVEAGVALPPGATVLLVAVDAAPEGGAR